MNPEKSHFSGDEGNSTGAKKQIYAILCVALVIVVVAAIFIVDKITEDEKKNEQVRLISENISSALDSNQKEAGKIKENLNTDLVGTYKSVGYGNDVTVELKGDGTFTVVSTGEKGWWTSADKDGIKIAGLMFRNTDEPYVYQVYGSYLVDTTSIYTGDVVIGQTFDSTLTLGNMTVTLKKNGKAEGRFRQTVEQDGQSIPYDEAYGGSYTVDGEHISLTLGGETSRFLIMDYDDPSIPDGMASLYYEKIN